MAGPGDGNVQPPLVGEEAKAALHVHDGVASDAVEDDHVFLSALEGVDSVDLNRLLEKALAVSAQRSQHALDQPRLRLVGRDDANQSLQIFQRPIVLRHQVYECIGELRFVSIAFGSVLSVLLRIDDIKEDDSTAEQLQDLGQRW